MDVKSKRVLLYEIVEKDTTVGLADAVEEMLDEGWELHGPPFVTPISPNYSGNYFYCQALTRNPNI